MKVLENNAGKRPKARAIWCTKCNSKLEITDAEIVHGLVKCPCCHQHFQAMTEAETTATYYAK